jgi:5-methylcytosine-specific restriction endonuclease McrA
MTQSTWVESKKFFEIYGFWKDVNHPIVTARKFRKYFLETKEHRCAICNNTKWMGTEIPLVLDHIDGNSENWSMSNLRLICGNCDMLLPTYKSKNKGHGRGYRKDRYNAGKTF